MERRAGAAVRLSESVCKDLTVKALARSKPVSDLEIRQVVSHKFVFQQTHDARVTLSDAGLSTTPESEMLFGLVVTKTSLRQVIVAFALI
jgi:hypothetical protein